jgi:hypothetical protein
MSGIASSRRRGSGRPANPSIDDFSDPIVDNGEYIAGSEELDGGGSDEEMEPGTGVPSEIADMVNGLGIQGDYRVTLFKIPEGKRKSVLQATYNRRVPEVDEFASDFGGGDYILVFTWYTKDGKGTQKNQRRVSISVGDHYNLIAKKKDMEKKRDFQMENQMIPIQGTSENPLEMLIKYQSLLPKATNSLDTVLPLIVGMMQQSSNQMMQMMQNNANMMVQMFSSKRSNIEEIKELMEVTQMLGGNNKSESISSLLITEGAGLLKEYAPVIREAIKGLNNPFTRRIAKDKVLANPDIQAILADPEKRVAFIEHLYTQHPANEVDNALIQLGAITEEERRSK